MSIKRVLVIDDEPGMRKVLSRALSESDYAPLPAGTAEEGLELLGNNPDIHVVVTDLNLPGMDGMSLLTEIKKTYPHIPVLIITAYSEMDSVITALRKGAYDYIPKPFKPELLVSAVQRAFEKLNLEEKVQNLSDLLGERPGFEAIIGESKSIKDLILRAQKMAAVDETVLITGESGTGKELFARAIHQAGPRSSQPFVVVNCAAIPENLLESELFGHKKGAFSGAVADKTGLIQAAQGGSIFFDEIGEISTVMQTKMLRFLQDHMARPVGGIHETEVDVRVIAATNRNLKQELEQGRFREDLYYRLRVLELVIPPLREHPEDIPSLICHFMKRCESCTCDLESCFSPEAYSSLLRYDWPGNVRELENLIKQMKVLCGGHGIGSADLPVYFQKPRQQSDSSSFSMEDGSYSELREMALEKFNREIVVQALEAEGGNISRAADRLKTPKSNLIRVMKKYGIKVEKQ